MTRAEPYKNEAVLQTAADWWARLRDPEVSDEVMQQWLEWVYADTRHLDAFEQVTDLGHRLGTLDDVTRRSFLGEFTQTPATLRPRPRFSLSMAAGLAAGLILIGYMTWNWMAPGVKQQVYASAVAENREITLPDGTRVALGGASRLATRFSKSQRQVELSAGEAFFQVVHDTEKPFVVTAGPLTIRDVGTAFDVRRTGGRVTIAVTEGRVHVEGNVGATGSSQRSSIDAVAGQLVSYDPAAPAFTVGSVTAEQATAWRSDRLEFNNEPLGVVVANINRYSSRQIRIADAHLEALTFTGVIKTDAIDRWLGALPQVLPLRVSQTPGEVTLSEAKGTQLR
ncbi:FecR family protein [Dokdonella soli]|uniref:FecR family protein n=1 Tax=Dokdonella soli TaxID=529810 RepID=A0ABP3U3Q0_9GAMM